MAVERELAAAPSETHGAPNAIFDESGHFLMYATLLGIKARRRAGVRAGGWAGGRVEAARGSVLCRGVEGGGDRGFERCGAEDRAGEVKRLCWQPAGACPERQRRAAPESSDRGVSFGGWPPALRGLRPQIVNLVSNKVSRILGKVENTERFLTLALYQVRREGRCCNGIRDPGQRAQGPHSSLPGKAAGAGGGSGAFGRWTGAGLSRG
jgi:hypothetical protein